MRFLRMHECVCERDFMGALLERVCASAYVLIFDSIVWVRRHVAHTYKYITALHFMTR